MGEQISETEEQRLLVEKIEVASEIMRKSQAVIAFQRVFYLEMLTFDRIEREVEDFITKVNRLQSKLTRLFNELQHINHDVGTNRASSISEKLDTLKGSTGELRKRTLEAKEKRERKSNELNDLVLPELNNATSAAMSCTNVGEVRFPTLSTFVNDQDFHLAEELSEEWGRLKRKLDNYFQRYIEDVTSLRVEIFGATFSIENSNLNIESCPRGLLQKISGLIQSRKSSPNQHHNKNDEANRSYSRSESFFYCANPEGVQSPAGSEAPPSPERT